MESLLIKAVVVILCYDLRSVNAQDFSYDGSMGPDHWGEQYNGCSGKYQSPINIDIVNVQTQTFDDLIHQGFYDTPQTGDIVNNGHTVVIHLDYNDEEPSITGGPLNGTFQFAQLHFHWGDNDTFGSEDMINNISYAAELHMVFYNQIYGNFDAALGHNQGVAVLAFFYTIQIDDNPFYVDLAMLLNSVQRPDHHVPFLRAPSLMNLATTDYSKYFTYTGSLTTPPCSEEVIWIDFEQPLLISKDQIEQFRHIYNHAGEPLTHNFRPIQPLNDRIVFRNGINRGPLINDDIFSFGDKKSLRNNSGFNYFSVNSATTSSEILSLFLVLVLSLFSKLFL